MCTMKTLIILLTLTVFVSAIKEFNSLNNNLRKEDLSYYLLPDSIKPLSYDISLMPYFADAPSPNMTYKFDGQVTITIQILKTTSNIIKLHAHKDITFKNVWINEINPSGPPPRPSLCEVASRQLDDRSFAFINCSSIGLAINKFYLLDIEYRSILNDDLEGFYRSNYTDLATGQPRTMATTQLEQMGARRVMPCWDEPRFKANFTLHIAHDPRIHNVLSNMPMQRNNRPYTGRQGWVWADFPTTTSAIGATTRTFLMPTYLLAFTVSDFQSITHPDFPSYKVWARPGAEDQGWYALRLAPKIVKYMQDFTNHFYTLPKLDQIAIPDFQAGAMENWGLITYRDSRLLFQEGVSTSYDRQLIEAVVTHEVAHQWFGNLVTCEWWSHIWLNEGFATYFEYHALATIEDTWQMDQQFIFREMYVVFETDARESTHPLLTDVTSPASSFVAFDNIAYNKGGCIVRFLIYLMGETNFKTGINRYLTQREFNTATPTHLWNALAPSYSNSLGLPTGKTFADVMNTWNDNTGYPVVTVRRIYGQNTARVTISQARFKTQTVTINNETWLIPLTMTSERSPNFNSINHFRWLDKVEDANVDLQITNLTDKQWILFNVKQVGYYRVNYDETNWNLLIKSQLDLHPINRAQIMNDALSLARANLLNYGIALETTNYLDNEIEYLPWESAFLSTSYLNDRLSFEQNSRNLFQNYMQMKMGRIYDIVNGFTISQDDSHILRLKRSAILKWSCKYEDTDCNTAANNLFRQWIVMNNPDKNNPIEPDLKSVVYCAGMQAGGENEYNFLLQRYNKTEIATEKGLILTAIGCASNTNILKAYLNESIKENSIIKKHDARSVHTAVYENYRGVDIALDFIINNWKKCEEVYAGPSPLGRAITGVSEKCNKIAQKTKLENFRNSTINNSNMDQVVKDAIAGGIQIISESINWHNQYNAVVIKYLEGKTSSSASSITISFSILFVSFLLHKL